MRVQDRQVFASCAMEKKVWILVRRTSLPSLQYIGLPGFLPKPADCPLLVADFGKFAGLVVDPSIARTTFNSAREAVAWQRWERFAASETAASGRFTTDDDPDSEWYGCVLFDGNRLHGSYDIYDVVDVANTRRGLFVVDLRDGKVNLRSPWIAHVRRFANRRIGCSVAQHSGDRSYNDYTDDNIDAFGPEGEYLTLATQTAIDAAYRHVFQNRDQTFHQPSRVRGIR